MDSVTKLFNPEAQPGLDFKHFRKTCPNGFGDRNNAFAYSMSWFKDHLYVGTSRANLCLLKKGLSYITMDVWPVECPYPVYSPEFEQTQARAEIWRYSPQRDEWERVFQSPLVIDSEGAEISHIVGFRAMCVFQGASDPHPVLYVAGWARWRGPGPVILRSVDGQTFTPVSRPGLVDLPITSTRLLIPFKERLYTSPTSSKGGNPNSSDYLIVYESADPASGEWEPVSTPRFGDPENITIFEMAAMGDYLYAGTGNLKGFQLWRTRGEGKPPYEWTQMLEGGAGRGALNQGVVSLVPFKGALYIGTGIQNGGIDVRNKVGPAGAEILRLHPDGSWDLIVGNPRDRKEPLSGLMAGFNNPFCGYLWRMCVHDGWLYAGTLDWSILLRFTDLSKRDARIVRLLEQVGVENVIANQGGCDVWRTYDGENWLPVTQTGFNNPFNYGVRTFASTPFGLFVGTANPFGPQVAAKVNQEWTYVDNPQGGLEVWRGVGKPSNGSVAG